MADKGIVGAVAFAAILLFFVGAMALIWAGVHWGRKETDELGLLLLMVGFACLGMAAWLVDVVAQMRMGAA